MSRNVKSLFYYNFEKWFRWLIGWIVKLIGICLLLFGLALRFHVSGNAGSLDMNYNVQDWMHLFWPSCCCLGSFLYLLGSKISRIKIKSQLRFDTRKPILYLRNFKTDGDPSYETVGLERFVPNREENLARILLKLGPVIALSNPISNDGYLGFPKLQVVDTDSWQQEITKYFHTSNLAVFEYVEWSNSIKWELAQALDMLQKMDIIILFKKKPEGAAKGLREYLSDTLKCFPDEPPAKSFYYISSNRFCIAPTYQLPYILKGIGDNTDFERSFAQVLKDDYSIFKLYRNRLFIKIVIRLLFIILILIMGIFAHEFVDRFFKILN